jgi:hypothetical protein
MGNDVRPRRLHAIEGADRGCERLSSPEGAPRVRVLGSEHRAHLLALAIAAHFDVKQMLAAPFYHPCLEEGVRGALREVSAKLPRTDASLELEIERD